MLPNNEGDLHYNQLAESSFKREQELEQEIAMLKDAMLKIKALLSNDKISTASFNHFTGDNMEREGFEQGAKWARDEIIPLIARGLF